MVRSLDALSFIELGTGTLGKAADQRAQRSRHMVVRAGMRMHASFAGEVEREEDTYMTDSFWYDFRIAKFWNCGNGASRSRCPTVQPRSSARRFGRVRGKSSVEVGLGTPAKHSQRIVDFCIGAANPD
jgi:hypothetical protein